MVTWSTCKRLGIPLNLDKSPWTLRGISGDTLDVLGQITLPLLMFGSILKHPFTVVEHGQFPGDLLVGFNFLLEHHIDVQPSKASLSRNNISIPLELTHTHTSALTTTPIPKPPTQPHQPTELTSTTTPNHNTARTPHSWSPDSNLPFAKVKHNTSLEPYSACLVKVKLSTTGKSALLTPDGLRVKGLVTEPAVYTPQGYNMVLRLLNATPHVINLKKNTRVADLELSDLNLLVQDMPPLLACTVQATTQQQPQTPILKLPKVGIPEAIPELENLLKRYSNILPNTDGTLGQAHSISHSIHLQPDTKPIYIPAYRLPHSKKDVLNNLTNDMLGQDIIEPSTSPWNSPILLVPKKDGSFRPVVDYRQLNKATIPDRFPIPILKDLLQDIGAGNNIFSTIDLSKGFWQVDLDTNSRPLTAFSTPNGHFHFKRMPFGLRNAPICFNRLMSVTLAGLIGPTCLLYLDDLIIASKTIKEHTTKLNLIFNRLAKAGLTINPDKSFFYQHSIQYLGHIVDHQGLRPNSGKIDAITSFPTPKNPKTVKSFLGLIGFYRPFIKNFGKIAIPLTNLLCKDTPFNWSDETEQAFQTLKTAITQAPVLIFPNYNQPFELTTDASASGLGAVLMQRVNGKAHPIAFASRKTSPPERKYSATDLEMLAIVWSLKHFKEIIYGYDITVFTDHQPLTYMCKDTSNFVGKHARWSNTFFEFNPNVKYTPGATNHVADALSRCHDASVCTLNVLDPTTLKESQLKHELYSQIIQILNKPRESHSKSDAKLANNFFLHNNLLYKHSTNQGKNKSRQRASYRQLVVTEDHIPTVLHLLHEAPHAAHQGIDKAVKAARAMYYFPRQQGIISDHIKRCQTCPYFKGHTSAPAPILSYDIASEPFHRVSMDILSGFVTTHKGNRYILACVDNFSRYTELIPLPDKKAETIAKAFTEHVILKHNTPVEILSDNGSEFINSIMQSLCNIFNVKHVRILPYRPQANGLTERLNRSILAIMKTLVPDNDHNWDDKVPTIQSSINSSYHAALGDIPHFVVYGRDKRLPYDLLNSSPRPNYTDQYIPTMLKNKQDIFKTTRAHLLKEQIEMNNAQHILARRKTIEPGILVFQRVRTLTAEMPKLAKSFSGPYRVIRVQNNKALIQDLHSTTESWSHFDELKLASRQYSESHDITHNLP